MLKEMTMLQKETSGVNRTAEDEEKDWEQARANEGS